MRGARERYRGFGDLLDHTLLELACRIGAAAALLEFDVRQPRLLVGVALHPPLEHGSRRQNVSDHLLEVCVFVPRGEGGRSSTRADRREGVM